MTTQATMNEFALQLLRTEANLELFLKKMELKPRVPIESRNVNPEKPPTLQPIPFECISRSGFYPESLKH